MNRIFCALLLAVALWPAGAGVDGEARAQDALAPLGAAAPEAALPAAGFEAAGEAERRTTEERPPVIPFHGRAVVRPPALRLPSSEALRRASVVLPRLDHLPYFATAPPSPR
jgi:hypothetical protein